MTFLLFDFHPFFDGLFGIDILKTLGAKVNLNEFTLETGQAVLPILAEVNTTPEVFSVSV